MINKTKNFSKASSKALILSLLVTITLMVGCGGGSSSGTVADVITSSTLSSTTASPPLIAPGAYVAIIKEKDDRVREWVSMLLPTTQGSGTILNFFGLLFNYESIEPDLFSGSGTFAATTNNATLTRVFIYPFISAVVRNGTGTIRNLGDGHVSADLTFPANGVESGRDISVVARSPNNYKNNSPATLSSVQGTWQGIWSYGVGSSKDFTLNISGQGELSSSMSFQQDCKLTQGSLLPNFDGTNLFTFSVTIPTATRCSLKSQALNGAAFVTSSPVAGKSQRLYLIGVTTDGRGISYRADR
jgi:hypothetical protein